MNDDERDALIRRIEDRRSKGALGPLQLSREEEDLVHYALTRAQDADRYDADLQGATDATTTAKAGKERDVFAEYFGVDLSKAPRGRPPTDDRAAMVKRYTKLLRLRVTPAIACMKLADERGLGYDAMRGRLQRAIAGSKLAKPPSEERATLPKRDGA